jgi:hypothetical protein
VDAKRLPLARLESQLGGGATMAELLGQSLKQQVQRNPRSFSVRAWLRGCVVACWLCVRGGRGSVVVT